MNTFDLAMLLNVFSLMTITAIGIESSIKSKPRKYLLLSLILSLEIIIAGNISSAAIGVLLTVLTGCILWLHIKYWQKTYVWFYRKKLRIKSMLSYRRSLLHTITKTKSGQILAVIFLLSLIITPIYVTGLNNNEITKIASAMLQFNGSFIGLFFVFLGFSYFFTPQKPIKVFESLHFRWIECGILLILINTFLLLVWIDMFHTHLLTIFAFSIEEVVFYLLGIIGIDFVTKRMQLIEEEILRAKTEEILKKIILEFENGTIYAWFLSGEALLIKEGFYTVIIHDDEGKLVDYFARTDVGIFNGITISYKYSKLMSLEDLEKTIMDELKSPRRYDVVIDLYLGAIEEVASNGSNHFFHIGIRLSNPPRNPTEIETTFRKSACLEEDFQRVKKDIEAGQVVM